MDIIHSQRPCSCRGHFSGGCYWTDCGGTSGV
jgi:hypothetical protein